MLRQSGIIELTLQTLEVLCRKLNAKLSRLTHVGHAYDSFEACEGGAGLICFSITDGGKESSDAETPIKNMRIHLKLAESVRDP